MKPEKCVYIQEKKQSWKSDPKTIQMLQLANSTLKQLLEICLKLREKYMYNK